MQRSTIILTTALVLASAPAIAAAAARAELHPSSELAVDTPAQLVVTVDESGAQAPRAPRIAGADVDYVGQVARTMIRNGASTVETSFVYTVVPREPGPLSIPSIRVGADTTEPIDATVAARGTRSPAGGAAVRGGAGGGGGRGGHAGGSGGAAGAQRESERADADEARRAFVRLDAPKRTLYVGEAVPVKIRAYFRAGTAATLQGPPRVSSPAFTLSELSDEPAQTQVEIDGVPYLRATWTAVLSPAKPTNDKVTIELPVEIAYREQRAMPRRSVRDLLGRDPFGGSPFGGDPFGGDPFGGDPFADIDRLFDESMFGSDPFAGFDEMFATGPMRQQTLTLTSSVGRVRIDEVPEAGKPAAFSGAIGSFELEMAPPKEELRVGEPATVTFTIRGSGNFDRVSFAGVPDGTDGWKVYPGTSRVELDADGVTGTKTFTQTLVPTRAGELELPETSFAYFDAAARRYRTVTADAARVVVAPSAEPATTATSPGTGTMAPRSDETVRGSIAPLVRQDSFWALPAGVAFATALLALVGWARRSPRVHALLRERRLDRRIAAQRARLDMAARSGDSAEFFDAARTALQLRLAARWGIAADSITAADVAARLGSDGDVIRGVFEKADDVEYAPGIASPGELDQWNARVRAQLATLEARR